MNELLDRSLVQNLRDVINKTNIFFQDSIEKEKFNLICAVMDRFDYSVSYINNHLNLPINEEEIILFLHHCCIIKDGIKETCSILNINNHDTNIFKEMCVSNPINLLPEEYKGDEKFFEYLRSLFFAHPFITNRSIPKLIKGEMQYSPYILNNKLGVLRNSKDSIGVRVYSNKRDAFNLYIKFADLQEYILKKYLVINNIIKAFQDIIDQKEANWKKRKVKRNQAEDKILLDIIDILKERYLESNIIQELYDYLTCEISLKENLELVNRYREKIKETIPEIANYVDEMEYEKMYETIVPIINARPERAHPSMHYQLEKIFCYLNEECYGDIDWGLKMAEAFSKEFAKNWVIIEPYNMDFKEIKLLTTIACYYESKKEGEGFD